MARNRKKNKDWNPDTSVQEFFNQTKEHFTEVEFDIIEEGYECLRQVVAPSMYSEIAMVLETVVLARRKSKKDKIITLNEIINEALNDSLIACVLANSSTERLRELKGADAIYVAEDNEEIVEATNKQFIKKTNINK